MDQGSVADVLVQILPVAAAERLAGHLTPSDVDTLRDLVRAAVPPNTVRAVTSDLTYLEAWSRAATGAPLSWPPSEADGLRFVAHHLFRSEEREVRLASNDAAAAGYGMPASIEAELRETRVLRGSLPHAPATVRRRIASWRRVAQARGAEDALTSSGLRRALAAGTKASNRPKGQHSQLAVTRDVLDLLVGEDVVHLRPALALRELRDRALLLVAFGTGGRRRSELGELRIERVFALSSSGSEGASDRTARGEADGLGIALGRTKTTDAQDGEYLVVTGRAQAYLTDWLQALRRERPDAKRGPIFRSIDRWGRVGDQGLSGAAVNEIVKRRAEAAGLDPSKLSAHGLRAGYLTEASQQGVPIEAAMRHSLHRSVQSAARYYRDQERASGKAAKLAG